jgi:NADH-ubiquinone oxidoreductase chain 4
LASSWLRLGLVWLRLCFVLASAWLRLGLVRLESRLIPTLFFLILGWGYQLEGVQAGIYLLFYTLLSSLPFAGWYFICLRFFRNFMFLLPGNSSLVAYQTVIHTE